MLHEAIERLYHRRAVSFFYAQPYCLARRSITLIFYGDGAAGVVSRRDESEQAR